MKNKAIFLDRDGVVNEVYLKNGKPLPPPSLENLKIYPEINAELRQIVTYGFKIFVVTNQPDVARAKTTRKEVERINNYLSKQLPIDKFYTCYHDDINNCQCRKPLPGLLIQAAKEFNIDLQQSFMVGDRWKDIEAGKSAGCQTCFIDYNYLEKQPTNYNFKATSPQNALKIIQGEIS